MLVFGPDIFFRGRFIRTQGLYSLTEFVTSHMNELYGIKMTMSDSNEMIIQASFNIIGTGKYILYCYNFLQYCGLNSGSCVC
jgi:hypothetical protein